MFWKIEDKIFRPLNCLLKTVGADYIRKYFSTIGQGAKHICLCGIRW